MSLSKALLSSVKNYLGITWSDPGTDDRVSGIVSRSMAYLNDVAGTAQDYESEGLARELLFDRTRYVISNALDEFERNYVSELLRLQMQAEVPEDDSESDEVASS